MAGQSTVLIIGNGGREHAFGWSFAQDPRIRKIWFAPGNAGTAEIGENLPLAATDGEGIARWAERGKKGWGRSWRVYWPGLGPPRPPLGLLPKPWRGYARKRKKIKRRLLPG